MTQYFGKKGPATTYMGWLKKIVILLAALNVVMFICLFIGYQYFFQSDTSSDNVVQASVAQAKTVDVLVALDDIPEGMLLTNDLFGGKTVREDMVPAGVLTSADKVYILGQFAKAGIPAGIPLRPEDVIARKMVNPFFIPENYRAVTINVDARTGVEGFAKPGTRVDVLWYHEDRRGAQLATIVRYAKVLSVGGITESPNGPSVARGAGPPAGPGSTATLLCSEKDAQILELARNMGTLSLTLVGEQDSKTRNAKSKSLVTVRDIMENVGGIDPNEISPDGIMTLTDRETGEEVKYNLIHNKWVKLEKPEPEQLADAAEGSNDYRRASLKSFQQKYIKPASMSAME